jgi:outer membrane protein OmpU
MKKALLGSTAIVGASLLMAGHADAKPEITLGGGLDFQIGWTSQDREGWSPTPGGVQGPATERGYSMFQRTIININASDTTDSGMKWAFKLDLNADADGGPNASNGLKDGTARDAADKVTLDLSDVWGSVSVGADYGVFRTMNFGSKDATKSAGTGGVDGSWSRWFNTKSISAARFESSTTAHDSTTSSRINYVTPRFAGFQAGVTYAMDRTTIGRFRSPESNTGVSANLEKNFWQAGVNYVNKFGDFDVGVSLVGVVADNTNDFKVDQKTYSSGFVVGYGDWKLGGRFSQEVKEAGLASTDSNGGYKQWDLGVGYNLGPWAFAASTMLQKGGVVNGTGTVSQSIYSFGTTYDMGGGLALYGELWYAKSKSVGTAQAAQANEGEGLITGVRVKF